MPPGGAWLVERRTGTAAELHEPWPDEDLRADRVVAICDVVGSPTLVLGSSQADPGITGRRIGPTALETARRSSGGGAVLVAPGAQVWVDVWLPRGDGLWDDDIVRSSSWLGSAWSRALADVGVRREDLAVHSGRLARSSWSDLICFAGVGPGEVCWKNRKLVGLAQRRTRAGARFHTMSPLCAVRVSQLPVSKCEAAGAPKAFDRREIDVYLAAQTTCLEEAVEAVEGGETVEAGEAVEGGETVEAGETAGAVLGRLAQSVVFAVAAVSEA
ncbi:MAG: hypothetical protein ACLP6E_15480 [Acidimicrobiales bacterium]